LSIRTSRLSDAGGSKRFHQNNLGGTSRCKKPL
jgi:hypothetical protein